MDKGIKKPAMIGMSVDGYDPANQNLCNVYRNKPKIVEKEIPVNRII
jgi:hypothetical protein